MAKPRHSGWTAEAARFYLAGIVDGEGCIWMGRLKTGHAAGEVRRTVVIGMTDPDTIDLIARLYTLLGIHFNRSDRKPKQPNRKHVWSIAVSTRAGLLQFAAVIPIQMADKQKRLAEIVASFRR